VTHGAFDGASLQRFTLRAGFAANHRSDLRWQLAIDVTFRVPTAVTPSLEFVPPIALGSS
jgi:hypothetical protein